MNRIIRILAAVALAASVSACAAVRQIVSDVGDGHLDSAAPETTEPDYRMPGGWFLYPYDTTDELCNGGIPCREMLNVCITDATGYVSPKWHMEQWYCTDASPTLADVCATVDPIHWHVYGLRPEDCPT